MTQPKKQGRHKAGPDPVTLRIDDVDEALDRLLGRPEPDPAEAPEEAEDGDEDAPEGA